MKEVTFSGPLNMRRGYKNEEHKLIGGSFFIRQIRDEDLGIFLNGSFLKSFYKKNNIKELTTSEFEELEVDIVFKVPDKFIKKDIKKD